MWFADLIFVSFLFLMQSFYLRKTGEQNGDGVGTCRPHCKYTNSHFQHMVNWPFKLLNPLR